MNDPILSPLPRVPASLERVLLSDEEHAAAGGGPVDAFDWLRAAGRLLRSPAVPVAIRQPLKIACGSAANEALLADVRARVDVELDVLGTATETWGVAPPKPGHAWAMLAARDDLESVAAALGAALRFAMTDGTPEFERLDALERFLVDRLHAADEAFTRVEDAILPALRAAQGDPLRARIAMMGDDPTAGFWFALAGNMEHSYDVLVGIEGAPEKVPRAGEEIRRPSLSIARWLADGLRAGTAAGQQDLLVAFREADREPVATLADGRITVRVRRPADRREVATTVTGLAIESDPPSLLVDVFAEAGGHRVDSRAVAKGAHWLSFADLAGAERWTLALATSEQHLFRVELRLAPDRAR